MRELGRKAELYKTHGGIHSAAIGDAQGLLLYAEDIGRHNTLDRLAGEALFRGWDLRDKMLVTSGRISSEMVAKAARLGIGLLAYLVQHPNQPVTSAELLEAVWGDSYDDAEATLRVHLHHLRRKIEPDPRSPRYVRTERGVGYRFQAAG